MTATFAQVRTALASTLNTQIPGLRASAKMEGSPTPPCIVILPARGTFGTYTVTFEPGVADYKLEAALLIAYGSERTAQDKADGYISTTSASVDAALLADPRLGGTVHFALVDSVSDYGIVEWAGVSYLGCRFQITAGVG